MTCFNDALTLIDFDVLKKYIEVKGTTNHYGKGEPMVWQGKRCRYVGIIKKGYFKYIVINSDGNEVVTGFSFPGEPVTDFVNTLLNGTPCATCIIAGAKAEVDCVLISDFISFLKSINNDFLNKVTPSLFQGAYQRYLDTLVKSPSERYQELVAEHPDFVDIIPAKELASFLGISRRQFQRIRDGK